MKLVFNATPLIHLAKAGLAWTIRSLEAEKYTTPAVYKEAVVIGREKGFNDAPIIDEIVRTRTIQIEEPPQDFLEFLVENHKDLHVGEAEVISLARRLEAIAIIDDPVARGVAEIYNVRKEGTYTIILRMLSKGRMNKREARENLQKLINSGWRCSIELYNRILKEIEEYQPPNIVGSGKSHMLQS